MTMLPQLPRLLLSLNAVLVIFASSALTTKAVGSDNQTLVRGILVEQGSDFVVKGCDEQRYSLALTLQDKQLLAEFPRFTRPYVEVQGVWQEQQLSALRWQHIAPESRGCQQQRTHITAMGNEPGWRVTVDPSQLRLTSINGEASDPLLDQGVNHQGMYWRGQQYQLQISQSACRGTMDGAFFAYQATLQTPERELNGCALLPFATEPQAPAMASLAAQSTLAIQAKADSLTTLDASSAANPKVEAALQRYFELHRTTPKGERYQWWEYDLNGNGVAELLVYVNWCGSGGCTLLTFEQQGDHHRFVSRTTLVHSPVMISANSHNGWQDLLLQISGGGANPGIVALRYDGFSYPLNPSIQPRLSQPYPYSGVSLRAKPFTQGVGQRLY